MACRIHFNWLFKVKYLKDASSRKCKEICKISISLFIPCGCDLEGEKQTFGRRVQSGNGSLYNVHCNHNNNNLWATCTTCTYWSFNHRRLDLVFKIFPLVNAWNMLSPSRWTPMLHNNGNITWFLPQTGNYDCYSAISGERKYYISSQRKNIETKCVFYWTQWMENDISPSVNL